MRELAWINGKVGKLSEAVVPLEDRGFLFGDGVYEVARIYNGKPFLLDEHLKRFQRSAAEIMLSLPQSPLDIEEIALNLIGESGCEQGWIYIQLTRGAAPRTHAFPRDVPPTLVMFVRQLPPGLSGHSQNGVGCVTLPDERWLHCHVKSVNLLPNILAREKAARRGAYEAILYRAGGTVTEASSANVFAVIDGVVRTHPQSNLILRGITRGVVLEILAEEKVACTEQAFNLDELKNAAEIWLSSSVAELVPVTSLNGEAVGSGVPGELTRLLAVRYRQKTGNCS